MSLHLYAKPERSTASDHRNLPPARDHVDADDGGRLSGLEQVQAQFTVVIRGRQRRMKRWKSMENDAFNCVCRKRRRESLCGHCFWFEYAVVVATVLCTWGAALPSLVVHCLAVDGGLWSQAAVAEERAENGDNQNEPRKDLSNLLSYYRNLICVSTWPPNNVDMAGSGYWIVRWRVVVVGFDKLHFNLGEFNLNLFQGNNWKGGFGKELFLWFE